MPAVMMGWANVISSKRYSSFILRTGEYFERLIKCGINVELIFEMDLNNHYGYEMAMVLLNNHQASFATRIKV